MHPCRQAGGSLFLCDHYEQFIVALQHQEIWLSHDSDVAKLITLSTSDMADVNELAYKHGRSLNTS